MGICWPATRVITYPAPGAEPGGWLGGERQAVGAGPGVGRGGGASKQSSPRCNTREASEGEENTKCAVLD